MKLQIKEFVYGVMVSVACSMGLHADSISFSFDQLYPTTSISRALNAMRLVLSLGQDLIDSQHDVDALRHMWLELYNASIQLVMHKETGRALPAVTGAPLHIPDDLREYMHTMWHHIGILYDQIKFEDASICEFLHHMRIACGQVIDVL